MKRLSTLSYDEVVERLNKAGKIIESLYYYFQDQEMDVWYDYCDASTRLERLAESHFQYCGKRD